MSRPQKSTIVRFQRGLAARLFRVADLVAPGLRRPDRPRPVVHGPAAAGRRARCPTAASRSRSSRSGPTSAGTSGAPGPVVYLVHGWGGTRLPARVVRRAPAVAEGFRVVMFDAPAHGDSDPGPAGPGRTHGVEFGKALDAVFARFGPAEAVVAHSLGAISTYLTLRFGWLSTRRLVLLAPMVAAEPLFDQFQRALGFGARTRRAFDRQLEEFVGIPMAEFDATYQAVARRPGAHARRARPRRPPDAVRRLGPARRVARPTPAWSPPTAWATGGSWRTPPSCAQVTAFLRRRRARGPVAA